MTDKKPACVLCRLRLKYACPLCNEPAGSMCRSKSGKKISHCHAGRYRINKGE